MTTGINNEMDLTSVTFASFMHRDSPSDYVVPMRNDAGVEERDP